MKMEVTSVLVKMVIVQLRPRRKRRVMAWVPVSPVILPPVTWVPVSPVILPPVTWVPVILPPVT